MNICNFKCEISCSNKCCTGKTAITLDELYKYKDIFIFGFNILKTLDRSCVLDERKQLINKDFICIENELYSHMVYFTAINNESFCEALENNLCKLHIDKPKMCICMPFDPMHKEYDQYELFNLKQKRMKNYCNGFLSFNKKSKNTLFYNNKFIDEKIRTAFYNYRKNLKLINNEISKNNEIKEFILEKCEENLFDYYIETHINVKLYLLIFKLLKFSEDEIKNFINSQYNIVLQKLNNLNKDDSNYILLENILNELFLLKKLSF